MLVLSRKKLESVIIKVGGIDIEVCVGEIRKDQVKLAFAAPRDVIIVRKEIIGKNKS